MQLLVPTLTFRYSWYRKDFVYCGSLMQNEDGSVSIVNVPRRSAPITHVSPLAIYDQREEVLQFTVRGIRFLRDMNIDLPSEVHLDDIILEKD